MKEENFIPHVELLLIIFLVWSPRIFAANIPIGGKVVWWGRDNFWKGSPTDHTNGVIESDNEILTNVVSVSANSWWSALLFMSDGTVMKAGQDSAVDNGQVLSNFANVSSIAPVGSSYWVVKRDGTVMRSGDEPSPYDVAGLSNVVSITGVEPEGYFVLRTDGSLWSFRGRTVLDPITGMPPADDPWLRPVQVSGKVVTNVKSITLVGFVPYLLKRDGTVWRLDLDPWGFPDQGMTTPPFRNGSANPAKINGNPLTNVVAIAGGGLHYLALKRDGTIVGSGEDIAGTTTVPSGLSNVVAVATSETHSIALKRDGTVVAWGDNSAGQSSVPTGLSNVIAIAAGGDFSMAVTTGNIPSSVYIMPHGRLEEMAREADLIFKGQVISSRPLTNPAFPDWAKPHATVFQLISVLKGKSETKEPVLWHYTAGPQAWGGGDMPSWYQFETGQCYLIFAARLDRPDYLYSPPADAASRTNEYRQLYSKCATLTLDARPLSRVSVKEAHWLELNRLLTNGVPTNAVYAIRNLNEMSRSCVDSWRHTDDFKRRDVLKAVLPLITNSNDEVSVSAIGCFGVSASCANVFQEFGGVLAGHWAPIVGDCSDVTPACIAEVAPYSANLVAVANTATSALCRVAAIASLSCTCFPVISNSLPFWLSNSNADVRAQAVWLLPDFPGEFCERALHERSRDVSPVVRAAAADAIGIGRFERLLPTLASLFSNSSVRTNSGDWPHKGLRGDDYFADIGRDDVHTSAGYALLKFDVSQVGPILKTNISDQAFGLRFIRKLSQNSAEPYLPLLASELKRHTAGSEQEAAKNGFHWPLSYWLGPDYGWSWDTLFRYVSSQTPEALAEPRFGPMLDALQIADDPDDARTRSLYEFFLDKGLIDRAKELRRGIIRRTGDKAIDRKSFNFPEKLKVFDEMDKEHSLKPGLGL